MRDAVRVALGDARSRGVDVSLSAARGAAPVQNPHQDEGSDNDADVAAAPIRGTRVFKLAPSDGQLAAAAYAWMRRHWGPRACVIDDGTSKARSEGAAFLAFDSSAKHATLGRHALDDCVEHADAVYATALEADPIFCSARTARRAGPRALVRAMGLRSFDPSERSALIAVARCATRRSSSAASIRPLRSLRRIRAPAPRSTPHAS
jgi:hypothetical protein